MIEAILNYPFMRHALIASILASIACGIIGTIIVEKKLVMMCGSISHISFGGIGLGYFLGFEPIYGALVFAVLSALGISVVNRKSHTKKDVIMGIFWSAGMALGVLFISFTPGYPPDMSSYLFGDILTVTAADLVITGLLVLLVLFVVISLYRFLEAYMFDTEFSEVLKINTRGIEILLYILLALTIVVLIKVVGIILVIALLTAPPAIARFMSDSIKKEMIISVILSTIFCLAGLWLSYELQIPSGATIIMTAALSYLIAIIIRKRGRKVKPEN